MATKHEMLLKCKQKKFRAVFYTNNIFPLNTITVLLLKQICLILRNPFLSRWFLQRVFRCGREERCHKCLFSACVGMTAPNGGGASEGRMPRTGTNARIDHEVMCFLLHAHTLHIPHIREIYTTCNHLTRKVILGLNVFRLQSQMQIGSKLRPALALWRPKLVLCCCVF